MKNKQIDHCENMMFCKEWLAVSNGILLETKIEALLYMQEISWTCINPPLFKTSVPWQIWNKLFCGFH